MQILKDEIREKILATAARLFYRQGFAKTPTRQIADEIGMSVSNIYKYFSNKAAIFDALVDDYYAAYRAGFIRFVSHDGPDKFDFDGHTALAGAIFAGIKADPVKFVLLMDKSEGTQYAGFKDETAVLLETHIIKGVAAQAGPEDFIIKIIVRNFFNGIVEIAKNYRNDEWAYKNISTLVQYHMSGIALLYQ